MGKALGVVLIVVACGMLVYLFAAPVSTPVRFKPSRVPMPVSSPQTTPQAVSPNGSTAVNPIAVPMPDGNASLSAPRSAEQRASDALEAQRGAYYGWAHAQASDRVADIRSADDDGATLLIYTTVDSADIAPSLTRDVVAPAAFQYGFRHVRYFVPNPPGSASQYRLDAEASSSPNGDWNTFHK